jgi:hypothetical protein
VSTAKALVAPIVKTPARQTERDRREKILIKNLLKIIYKQHNKNIRVLRGRVLKINFSLSQMRRGKSEQGERIVFSCEGR